MFAKLSALVSGGSALPFDITEVQGEPASGPWTLHSATLKSDKTSVSVFKFTFSPTHDSRITNAARHGVKSLRTLRHPNILSFKDSLDVEEKGSTTLYIITEPVRLLSSVLSDNQLSTNQKNEYLSMGLQQVACALSFLNNDCHQVHGNVSMSSIVVSQNLDWKLSFMDTLSEQSSLSSSPLNDSISLMKDVYKCPELMRKDWEGLQNGPPWAIDSWGLGCLIREIFSEEILLSTNSLRDTSCIPPDLLKDYQRLLNSNCEKRLNPKRLLNNKYLNNGLVEVVKFLESLAVKEAGEKNSFFKKLVQTLPDLPTFVIHQKILPMIIDAVEFGSAASPLALGCIMKISEDMKPEDFETLVVPALTRLFASTDRTTRRILLENIEKFADRLSSQLINDKIYPSISNGFSDANAYLRELTLKSMQHLAPKLTQKTLNQSLLKFLARLQVDAEPSIRANTTVLLGFIAEYLGEASCKRILLNAFSRALKDQFPPTRLAAAKAFVGTKNYYSVEEVATRVIPSISPLCIDTVEDVKNVALCSLSTFVTVLKEGPVQTEADKETETVSQKTSSSQNYVSWVVSSLGFSQTTVEPETKKTEPPVEKNPNPTPPRPPVVVEKKEEGSGDNWDIDEEDMFESGPSTPTEVSKQSSKQKEENVEEGDDMWSDLGMKAPRPQQRRTKTTQKSKPMKLGATKLNTD